MTVIKHLIKKLKSNRDLSSSSWAIDITLDKSWNPLKNFKKKKMMTTICDKKYKNRKTLSLVKKISTLNIFRTAMRILTLLQAAKITLSWTLLTLIRIKGI